jgi:hypothetical protein
VAKGEAKIAGKPIVVWKQICEGYRIGLKLSKNRRHDDAWTRCHTACGLKSSM